MHLTARRRRAVGLIGVLAFGIVACGDDEGSDSGTADDGTTAAPASTSGSEQGSVVADGDNRTIVGFVGSRAVTYLAQWQDAAAAAAEAAGYEFEIIEQTFDQAVQNQQIQQRLSSRDTPAAFVIQPADANAVSASLAAMAETGVPVFVWNNFPLEQDRQLVTAYAGVNDTLIGENSGELMLEAREALREIRPLSSDGGNVLIVNSPPTIPFSYLRENGLRSVIEPEGFSVIGQSGTSLDQASGFEAAAALIAAHRDEGIDFIWAQNDATAAGVIEAAKQAGLEPGTNVMVIGANCRDETTPLTSGEQFGTNLQGAALEGEFSMEIVLQYLENPRVQEGDYNAPPDPESKPQLPDTISNNNFIPTPPVKGSEIDEAMLWGGTFEEHCSY